MNNALCIERYEETSPCEVQTRSFVEDRYSTEPLAVVRPIVDLELDEEDVYTSFEDAISGRVLAVHSRLERLSHPELVMYPKTMDTGSMAPHPSQSAGCQPITKNTVTSFINRIPMRWLIQFSLAFIFLLLGFDLMGLLVLSAR